MIEELHTQVFEPGKDPVLKQSVAYTKAEREWLREKEREAESAYHSRGTRKGNTHA